MKDGVMSFDTDLLQRLAEGDARYTGFLDLVDAHVARAGLDVPEDPDARIMLPDTPELTNPPRSLEFRAKNINALVWATGYRPDFSWIDGPVFDADGVPIHRGGITEVPGLYLLGLRNLYKRKSSFLHGVGEDAARLADHIVAQVG
jgi:putative flavoprotein involved in K+ transport